MDRNLMRKLARTEYKKMMKSLPRSQRPTFNQAWPLIKATLEGKMREPEQAQLTVEDAAALEQMMMDEPAEHVHGPECNHDVAAPTTIEV